MTCNNSVNAGTTGPTKGITMDTITTPTPVRWRGHGRTEYVGYAWRVRGTFTLVSASSHPNSPKHWAPTSTVSAR